jgi:hypothetical protein
MYEARADYVQGTRISFRSKEDAIHFAEKQGMFTPFTISELYSKGATFARLGLLCVSLNELYDSCASQCISIDLTAEFELTTGNHHPQQGSRPRTMQKILSINNTNSALFVQSRMYSTLKLQLSPKIRVQAAPLLQESTLCLLY